MKSVVRRVKRFRERFAQAIDRESASDVSVGGSRIDINNPNVNIVRGSGTIYNNNPVTIVFHSSPPQNENAMQTKIAAALQARHVPQAVYNAHLSSGCMDGTRVEVIRVIETWIESPDEPPVFWLVGMAGMGKTAISWTICDRASVSTAIVLGGSFFCSRSTGSIAQRDVRCVIPTLAQLLAYQSTEFSTALAEELACDPGVLHKQVKVQIEQLLYKPLLALKTSSIPILFVIDALDECGGQSATDGIDDAKSHQIVSEMLEALVALSNFHVKLPVRFLVTSRPETHIRDTRVSDSAFSKALRLHTIDKQQVTADIRLYISARLSSSPRLRNNFTTDEAHKLAVLSDGLFIFATTALHYILSAGIDSALMRFESLLNSTGDALGTRAAVPLDRMYTLILDEATKTEEPEAEDLTQMLQALASILTTRTTLSVSALADLLGFRAHHLRAHLTRLHAVVHVPDDDAEPGLRTLHASFGDYLFGRAPPKIRVVKSFGHDVLTRGCLMRMAQEDLCFNVSHVRSSYEDNDPTSADRVVPSLAYACLQWAHHIATASNASELESLVEQYFIPKFLFWLEVLSLLKKIGVASGLLRIAGLTVKRATVSRFLRDANSFVASSREPIERSAPHIYLSALPFAARDSLIYQRFVPLCKGLISAELLGIERHGGRLVMTLTGHEDIVHSVSYSPDGHHLISGSEDGTIRIWNMQTGEETMAPLQSGNGSVHSVAFSPNGQSIASGTETGIVCIWTGLTSRPIAQRLSGHDDVVSSVVFSPDGSILASLAGSWDHTIRLWAAGTGESIAVLNGHEHSVNAVAFSSDGVILVSGSHDKTTRIWQVGSGRSAVQSLVLRDQNRVHSVCFSSDGGMLASGIRDGTIVLRESLNWNKITTLHGHVGSVFSVQFSSDGQSLVSASSDKSVRIWTLRQDVGEASSVALTGHTGEVRCCKFSSDGLYIASASQDRTVCIWDATSSTRAVRSLPAHDDTITSVAVSPDDSFIVSGSRDYSVRVWDARTGEPRFPPLLGHTDVVLDVAISCDGLMIASASTDHTVRIWSLLTGEAIGEPLRGHEGRVRTVSFSPDGQILASGSNDGILVVCIWNVLKDPPSIVQSLACGGDVKAVAFSPHGRLLAADRTNRIHLWQAATGQPVREVLEPDSLVLSVEFSPSQTHIVSAEWTKICVRDISTGERTLVLEYNTGLALSATFSPNGHYICAGAGGSVRLWDAKLGTSIAALHGHVNVVQSVVFTPSGKSIVSCAPGRTIRVWDVEAACSPLPQPRDDPISALTSSGLTYGWVLGPSGELLLWVPEEYRDYIQVLPCTTLIGSRRIVIKAGKDGLHRGENWTKCWRNAKPTPLSNSI